MGKVDPTKNNYCIKVYYNDDSDTAKKNAEKGVVTDQLQVDKANGRYSSGLQEDGKTMQYFMGFRKYWYRIEFSEPAAGFYIDWDDGEDNSKEKSNSQTVYFEKPQTYGVVSHIYTKFGAHFPLVRAINLDGFWSKYYTTNFSGDDFTNEWAELEEDPQGTLPDVANEYSIVSTTPKTQGIPHFYPTTLPPVAVLKTDRSTVYSGIDNNICDRTTFFAESVNARRILPSIVYADYEASGFTQTTKDVEVELTFEDVNGYVRTKVITTKQDEANFACPDVRKVIKARLLNLTEGSGTTQLAAGERVYLRASRYSSSNDGADKVTGAEAASFSANNTWVTTTGSKREVDPGIKGIGSGVSGKVMTVGMAENNAMHTTALTKIAFGDNDTVIDGSNIMTVSNIAGSPGIPTGTQIRFLGLAVAYANVFEIALVDVITGIAEDPSIFTVTATAADELTVDLSAPVSGGGYVAGAESTSTNILGADNTAFLVTVNKVGLTGVTFSTSTANVGALGTYGDNDPVITTLSLGWPEQSLDDRGHFVTADFSESRTRAANLDILFDQDHLWFDDGKFDWVSQPKTTSGLTDTLDRQGDWAADLQIINEMNESRTRLEYTQDPFVDDEFLGTRSVVDNRASATDDEDGTGRFVDDFRQLRLQVRDNRDLVGLQGTDGGAENSNDTFSYSILAGWRRFKQNMLSPANTTTIIPDELDRASAVWYTHNSGTDWVSLEDYVENETKPLFTLLEGTATAGTTTRLTDAGTTISEGKQANGSLGIYADDYWNGCYIEFTSGDNEGTIKEITDSDQSSAYVDWSGGITTVVAGDTYRITGPVSADTFTTSGTQTTATQNHLAFAGGKDTVSPVNYMIMAREEKFDGLYFGIKNLEDDGLSLLNTDTPDLGITSISISYPVADWKLRGSLDYTRLRWKPLAFIDYTKTPKKNTSLYVSGPVMWEVPDDWEKTTSATGGGLLGGRTMTWPAGLTGIIGNKEYTASAGANTYLRDNAVEGDELFRPDQPDDFWINGAIRFISDANVPALGDTITDAVITDSDQGNYQLVFDALPEGVATTGTTKYSLEHPSVWSWDAYAILISIHYKAASGGTPPRIKYVHPINREETSVIRVQDSMHVSLNDVVVAQSASWSRNGKYQKISDRIGKAELRKIGAEGGSIRFGGISFGDYSTEAETGFASHKKVKRHQQEGTPVYIDMQYPNGNYIRFFGKILSLSEDIPTGRVSQKWALDLGIEAIAEFESDGTWVSDGLISIGGEIDDRSQYL